MTSLKARKSTEHNLDLAFNSLDAQREACEAYVRSQVNEGWRLIPASACSPIRARQLDWDTQASIELEKTVSVSAHRGRAVAAAALR
jgi:hypothetical protein